jgi:hypothetical protein
MLMSWYLARERRNEVGGETLSFGSKTSYGHGRDLQHGQRLASREDGAVGQRCLAE